MIDFPNSPTNGQVFTSVNTSWVFDGSKWLASNSPAAFLPLSGGTLTGSLNVTGAVVAQGSGASLTFSDRVSGLGWTWYASGGIGRLFDNGSGLDRFSINAVGDTTLTGILSVAKQILAQGYQCRSGLSGSFAGNKFNINYPGNELWVDDTNFGGIALLASPVFTGTPSLPTGTIAVTQAAANNTTAIATTAYVKSQAYVTGGPYLPLSGGTVSGALTINGATTHSAAATALTVATADNSTNIATTAFVKAQGYVGGGPYLPLTGGTLSGSLTVAGGVYVTGAAGALVFYDRVATSHNWAWYASGDVAYLGNASTTPIQISYTGGVGINRAPSIAALDVGGAINSSAAMTFAGRNTIYNDGGYTLIYEPSGNASIFCGHTVNFPNNYYRNVTHRFQPISGAADWLTINASTVQSWVGLSVNALVASTSTSAGYQFVDRNDGNSIWLMYAYGGLLRWWCNNTGTDKFTVDNGGVATFLNNVKPNIDNNWYCGVGPWALAWAVVSAYTHQVMSDVRLKTDITDLPECLSLVEALSPKRYRFTNASEKEKWRLHWGFVAQEVGAVMDAAGHDFSSGYRIDYDDRDESVRSSPSDHHSLSYSDLTAVLWKAVQELSAEVQALREKVG